MVQTETAPAQDGPDEARHATAGRYGWGGLVGAVLFGASSFTPSLLPRSPSLQGLLAGIAARLRLRRSARPWPGRPAGWSGWQSRAVARRARAWLCPGGRRVAAFTVVALVAGWRWQVDLHELMGEPAPRGVRLVLLIVVLLCSSSPGWWQSGAVPATAGRLGAPAHGPATSRSWLASTIAVAAVVLLVVGVITGVICRGFLAVSNAIFCVKDTATDRRRRASRPSAERSGSPASLVAWDTLGRAGPRLRRDRPDARTDHRVHRHTGQAADPGVRRAAVRSRRPRPGRPRRTGAAAHRRVRPQGARRRHHDRDGLGRPSLRRRRWSTCGTATPRSRRCSTPTCPAGSRSWRTSPRRRRPVSRCSTTSTTPGASCPPTTGPSCTCFGESLGSFGGHEAFTSAGRHGGADVRRGLAGTPNFTALWKSLVDDRDAGSLERLPVYQHGRIAPLGRAP